MHVWVIQRTEKLVQSRMGFHMSCTCQNNVLSAIFFCTCASLSVSR